MNLNVVTSNKESAVIGSGELYAAIYDPSVDYETLATEDMDCLGFIEESAELKATTEKTDINRGLLGSIITNRDVEFATGIFTWNLEKLSKYCTGSKIVTSAEGKKRSFYWGENDNPPQVVLRFISKSDKRKITLNMFRCQWTGDLSFPFGTDKPITFDYTFKVLSATMPNGELGYFSVDDEDLTTEEAA